MHRLQGKVAIVTGAAAGLGRAIAVAFASEGASVVVSSRVSDERSEETVRLAKAAGGEAMHAIADVSKESHVENLVQTAVDTYGRLDVMVNNAGVCVFKPIEDLTEEDFDFMVGVNQKGAFFGIKHAVIAMKACGGGSIINISSVNADHGALGSLIYAGTKGALVSMGRVAGVELGASNIRVNTIQPGLVRTEMVEECERQFCGLIARAERHIPQGELQEPEDVAALCVFLAADESRHITAQKLAVDGGLLSATFLGLSAPGD